MKTESQKEQAAESIAQQIVAVYDRPEQVAAVAANGCGEWEQETADTLTAGTDIEAGVVLRYVEAICSERADSKTTEHTAISIAMDGIWAGSGKLRDGIIEDCGAQFCQDNDESLEVYEMIEEAIAAGRDHVTVEFSDDDAKHCITWSVVEPM